MPTFLTTLLASGGGPIREWYSDPGNPSNSGCMVDGIPTLKCIEIVFSNLLVMASGLVILILFIMFVVGAFNYLTSLGDEEKMTNARNTFTYAIIGLVVFVSAGLILWIIDMLFLGGQGRIFEFRIGV